MVGGCGQERQKLASKVYFLLGAGPRTGRSFNNNTPGMFVGLRKNR